MWRWGREGRWCARRVWQVCSRRYSLKLINGRDLVNKRVRERERERDRERDTPRERGRGMLR